MDRTAETVATRRLSTSASRCDPVCTRFFK
jgi:hypothetical protein